MGVFLRWGIFGILAVAALVYAYNSTKHLASRRPAAAPAAPAAQSAPEPEPEPEPAAPPSAADSIPERCAIELDIARRALESRSIGEPLDRLLRIQEIAWQEDVKRRERLTNIATRWYSQTGSVDPALLRKAVVDECLAAKP